MNVDASTVCRRVKQFQEEASVAAKKNEGDHKMTDLEQFDMLEAVLKNPGICVKFSDMLRPSLGLWFLSQPFVASFNRITSRKKLHFVASQRSEEIHAELVTAVCTVWKCWLSWMKVGVTSGTPCESLVTP